MRITVENMGTFEMSEEFLPQLMAWVSTHSGVKLRESNQVMERTDSGFTGRELLQG
jgi:hypothetical protein